MPFQICTLFLPLLWNGLLYKKGELQQTFFIGSKPGSSNGSGPQVGTGAKSKLAETTGMGS